MTNDASPTASNPASAGYAYPLTIMNVAGSQRDMGIQHADMVRECGGYDETIDFYPRMPERVLRHGDRSLTTTLLVGGLRPLLELALRHLEAQRPAAYRARSEAFISRLGRPRGTSRYLMVMDLLQNVIGLAGRYGLGPFARRLAHRFGGQCSSCAAWGRATVGGRVLHARNFDFPGTGVWERRPALVFAQPDEGMRYAFVTAIGADAPGITVFNEAGLTLTSHTRFHRDVAFRGATIVDLCHDIIRRAGTLQQAADIARERQVASSWGLLVSSASERRSIALEINAKRVEVVQPGGDTPAQWIANRYQHPLMAAGEASPSPAFEAHSDGREEVMRRWLQSATGLDVADFQRLLGSHEAPDLRGRERATGGVLAQTMSVQSVVNDPERRVIWVSTGPCPTGKGPWVPVPWQWRETSWTTRLGASDDGKGRSSGHYDRGPSGQAHRAFVEAARLDGMGASSRAIELALNKAVALDPGDPSYRHLAGGFALRAGSYDEALDHFDSALANEASTFRRGELLLWASRAASAAGRSSRAEAYRRRLTALDHPRLAEARSMASRERRRPMRRRELARISVDLQLLSIG